MKELLCDRYKCYFCDFKKLPTSKKSFRNSIEMHHIIEKNKGGNNEPSNLVPCCSTCHSLIHENKIIIDKWYFSTKGWILKFQKLS
jgi:5-methylcytosine-specific restriction endonuclease McrA